MNKSDMLKIQGGYRNTIIPYPINAYKEKLKNINTRTGIYETQIKAYEPFIQTTDTNIYNSVQKSQMDIALKYIQDLRKLKEQGKMREYNNKVELIYDIMNSYEEPVAWVEEVFNYINK